VYDMYLWNAPGGHRHAAPPASAGRSRSRTVSRVAQHGGAAARPQRPGEAARALQEALDRRDNGGGAAAGPRA